MNLSSFFSRTFDLSLGKMVISPSYLHAAVIIFLLFLLVLTLAQVRRHFLNWSIKGSLFGIFLGFVLALILEGFMIVGGKTVFTEVIGWKNAPKPLLNALEVGRTKLVSVLGVTSEIEISEASGSPQVKVVSLYQSLPPREQQSVRYQICTE